MGAARSRSHRAGGRPSIHTRMLLPHAVRRTEKRDANATRAQNPKSKQNPKGKSKGGDTQQSPDEVLALPTSRRGAWIQARLDELNRLEKWHLSLSAEKRETEGPFRTLNSSGKQRPG